MKPSALLAGFCSIVALLMPDSMIGAPTGASAPSPFGANWGYLYGHAGVKTGPFLPGVRNLGGGFSRIIVFWQQIEPQKGQFDWSALDTYVGELNNANEGFITVYSASQWATSIHASIMPAISANNPEDYYRFVFEMVKRYRGRVRYWGNDSEPTNPAFWAGTKEQYVSQLRVFHRAVKDADPDAMVVLGGCDGLFVPPGLKAPDGTPVAPTPGQEHCLAFFDFVLREAGDAFDVFDLHLYLDPETIVPRVEYIRERMRANGYEKAILAGEYGGPSFYELADNLKYLDLVMKWSAKPDPSIGQAIAKLYEQMASLSPQTQMFMQGCAPELEAKYRRIQSRTIVMQNLYILSAGIKRSLYWQYSPATNERDDIMGLMFSKFGLMEKVGSEVRPSSSAATYRLMTSVLEGVVAVKRVPVPDHPTIVLFEVDRGPRGIAFVVWERRDKFSGEDTAPIEVSLPSKWAQVDATDALGALVQAKTQSGKLIVSVGATPVYLTEAAK